MNIVQIVPSVEDEASGPTYAVTALHRSLRAAGAHSTLIATGPARRDLAAGVEIFSRMPILHRLGRSPDMYRWLQRETAAGGVDIVHTNGLWMMPNIYPGWIRRRANFALVVSPHGTLSRWALQRSRVVKTLVWHSLQKRTLVPAALFHATAEHEYADIRRLGFRQPVAVLPNGVHLPAEALVDASLSGPRTLLFLGRVHPVKGVDRLLRAWVGVQEAHPSWRLRIVGPGDPIYVDSLKALAIRLGALRISFEGPLYGADKWTAYREANLFILPTHSENFGMAIAEALSAGCPVVTTRGAPWSGLVDTRSGWWIDSDTEPLRLALAEAMSKSIGELAQMGARGRAWMEREFAWEKIAEKMIESYRWIREGGSQPDWIRND